MSKRTSSLSSSIHFFSTSKMNSKTLYAANRGGSGTTPDGIIPNTYYDNNINLISCCSTPYVSAPSSPGRGGPPIGYFYSAPSSPMHNLLKSAANLSSDSPSFSGAAASHRSSFEFDFGVSSGPGDTVDDDDRPSMMSSADELFLNGQIRPMKLSSHLERPQNLAPLIDVEEGGVEIEVVRGRVRDRSLRRKARSLSPLRTEYEEMKKKKKSDERSKVDENPSTSSSRSSSGGTSSKRWVFLKDFIRSKSDGSRHAARLWSSISFSNRKSAQMQKKPEKVNEEFSPTSSSSSSRLRNGISAHYTAKRAQAEEMRRRTFLPYRQGLLGCLGFSSKSYGAMTTALDSRH